MSTTVTRKRQFTIPKPVRDLLGIRPGSQVGFDLAPALFVAAKVYPRYRQAGGVRTGVLPDFFVRHSGRTGTRAAPDPRPAPLHNLFPTVTLIAP